MDSEAGCWERPATGHLHDPSAANAWQRLTAVHVAAPWAFIILIKYAMLERKVHPKEQYTQKNRLPETMVHSKERFTQENSTLKGTEYPKERFIRKTVHPKKRFIQKNG